MIPKKGFGAIEKRGQGGQGVMDYTAICILNSHFMTIIASVLFDLCHAVVGIG